MASNQQLMHYGVMGMKWGVRRYQNPDGTRTAAGKKHERGLDKAAVRKKAANAAKVAGVAAASAGAAYGTVKAGKTAKKTYNDVQAIKKEASQFGSYSKTTRPLSSEEKQAAVKEYNLNKAYEKTLPKDNRLEKTKLVVDSTNQAVNQVRNVNRKNSTPHKERMDLSQMTDKELRDKINRENLERQYSDMFGEYSQISKGQQAVNNTLDAVGDVLAITGSSLAIALSIKALKG